MTDLVTVTAGIWQFGAGTWRFLQALGTFNYQIITSLFRFLCSGWSAACVITSSLCGTVVEIVTYLFEVVVELGRYLSVCLQFVYRLTVLALNLLIVLYGIVELAAIEVAGVLKLAIRWATRSMSDCVENLGISSQALKRMLTDCYDSFASGLSNTVWYIITCINELSTTVLSGASNVFENLYAAIKQCATLVFDCLECIILGVYMGLVWFGSFVWDILTVRIPDLWYQTVATSSDFHVLLVITAIAVIVFMRFVFILRQKGLTLPFVWQTSISRSTRLVNAVLEGAGGRLDAQLVVSDDEEEMGGADRDDGDIYDAESGADSDDDGNTSTTTARTNSTHSGQHSRNGDFHESSDSDISSVVEYEVVDEDSDIDALDENDQNVINVQLPERSRAYALRSRVTPSPARSLHTLGESDLARYFEKERDKRSCVVCQDQVKNVVVLPCKHMCLCVDCAHAIVRATNPARRVCPLCRGRINTVMNVYV